MSFDPSGGGISNASDVVLSNPATNETLTYDGAIQKWKNQTAPSGTVASAGITDATAIGRSVLTAADAASARTAISAGTSNLVIGSTATTAKRGDYIPFAKVVHGANASIARPAADYVLWEGSVQPTNWLDGDDWNETA